jgi:hypothetical protein
MRKTVYWISKFLATLAIIFLPNSAFAAEFQVREVREVRVPGSNVQFFVNIPVLKVETPQTTSVNSSDIQLLQNSGETQKSSIGSYGSYGTYTESSEEQQ